MSVHHVEISCCTILITCVGSKVKLVHAHIHSLSIVHTHTHTRAVRHFRLCLQAMLLLICLC